jgi:hypothetical protein
MNLVAVGMLVMVLPYVEPLYIRAALSVLLPVSIDLSLDVFEVK